MRISRDSWLKKPEGDAKISEAIFGYLTARVRQRAYDIIVRAFKDSGLSQADLARRWGKDPAIVSRFLARPGNWELDTYTEAMFAIAGAIPVLSHVHLSQQDMKKEFIVLPSAAEPRAESSLSQKVLKISQNYPAEARAA